MGLLIQHRTGYLCPIPAALGPLDDSDERRRRARVLDRGLLPLGRAREGRAPEAGGP